MKIINTFTVIFSQLVLLVDSQKFLSVSGNNLTLNGEKVFLSGMNQAWYNYARDFGKQFYSQSRQQLLRTLNDIQQGGGNSVSMYFDIYLPFDRLPDLKDTARDAYISQRLSLPSV